MKMERTTKLKWRDQQNENGETNKIKMKRSTKLNGGINKIKINIYVVSDG